MNSRLLCLIISFVALIFCLSPTDAKETGYIGCFHENITDPILPDQKFPKNGKPMRPNRCRKLCDGYDFFGLRNGTECWCGDADYAAYGAASESECNLPCEAGNKNCGGTETMSVYRVTLCSEVCNNHTTECVDSGVNKEITTCLGCQGNTAGDHCESCLPGYSGNPATGDCYIADDEYIGCFNENVANPILSVQKFSNNNNPIRPNRCRNLCEGFRFFGLRNGSECWCGNADYTFYGAASESQCNLPCASGNKNCGGTDVMSVYRVTPCSQVCNNHTTVCLDSGVNKEITTCLGCQGNTQGAQCQTCLPGFFGNPATGSCFATDDEYIGCFNENVANPILSVQKFSNKNNPIRPNRCRSLCEGFRFFGLRNGSECWCGNADYAFYGAAGESQCNLPCAAGNKNCGGTNVMSVYRVTPCSTVCNNHSISCFDSGVNKEITTCLNCQDNTAGDHCDSCPPGYVGTPATVCTAADDEYIGCFNENLANPVFSVQMFAKNGKTIRPNRCRRLCEGYHFFGLRNGTECWCGNADYSLYGAASESECNLPCEAGKANCGGISTMSVYRVSPCSEVCNGHSVVCLDSGVNREITTCLDCQGNTEGDHCDTCLPGYSGNPATGDCLGEVPPVFPAADDEYIGCFNENVANPILSVQMFSKKDNPIRPNRCRNLCEGYRFFGLRNGTECWCGNANYALYGIASESQCNLPCAAGNKNCGGTDTMSVYRVTPCSQVCNNHTTECVDSGVNRETTTCLNCQGNTVGNLCENCLPGHSGAGCQNDIPSPFPAADDDYIGCFNENVTNHILPDQKFSNHDNPIRPNRCRKLCDGYRFFGLMNGNECWCGNADYAFYGLASESECNLPCATGNKNCGGTNVMSVYRVTPCSEVCNNHTTVCADSGVDRGYTTCLDCQGNTGGSHCEACLPGYSGAGCQAPTDAPTDAPTEAPTEAPTQPPTQPPLPSGCISAPWTFTMASSWPNGFQATLSVTTPVALFGWKIYFNLPGGSVTSLWNGDWATTSSSSSSYVVISPSWNAIYPANGVISLGMIGSGAASVKPTTVTFCPLPAPALPPAPAPASGCLPATSTFTVASSWANGLQATLSVTTPVALFGWSIYFELPGGSVTSLWNGNWASSSSSSSTYAVISPSWNAIYPANGVIFLGMTLSGAASVKPTNILFCPVAAPIKAR